MTVSSSTDRATFVGNGIATVFPLPFRFFANSDIQAGLLTNATGVLSPLTLGTHYTLTGAGLPEQDGNAESVLTMLIAPTALQSLYVQRAMPLSQLTDIVNQGRFLPEIHENVFDRLTMLIQQASGNSSGAIRVAVGDPEPARLPPAATRAGSIMGFDSSGNPVSIIPNDQSASSLALLLASAGGAGLVGTELAPFEAGPITIQDRLDALARGGNIGYQVMPNRTIQGPDLKRFIAHGVTMFDYLFASYEARTDQLYRKIYEPVGKGPGTGISEPTYYARLSYKNEDYVEQQIKKARDTGINLIRVAVEPAIFLASVPYIDPTDGLTYQPDLDMLDTIIRVAENLGVVVQLQSARDEVGTANNVTFMGQLVARYFDRANVWINPANEINGTNADVNNPTVWAAEMRQYVIALRADVAGQPAGTKFIGPVVIDPPGWATRIDLINTTLTSDTVFSLDPNLIINVHYYSQPGESDWRTTGLPFYQAKWVNYIPNYCIMVGEVGIDNFAGRFDPNLDPGIPSDNLTTWAQMQSSVSDFLDWSNEQLGFTQLNGVIGHMWFAYIPGLLRHDDNSMYRQDGTITTWGGIFRSRSSAPTVSILQARRQLGAQFSTGAWTTGDIADDSIVNSKLGNMVAGTIKGRLTAGTADPEDLTRVQILAIISGLTAQANNGTMGTPAFQAEGATGSRAAAAMIVNAVSDVYIGMHNRTTGLSTGAVVGNGTTGVNYTTVSDYRLKLDPLVPEPADVIALLGRLRPVEAGWLNSPESPRELMFLAHEIQSIIPAAVTGKKDEVDFDGNPIFQSMDYAKVTPLLAAALKVAIQRIEILESKIGVLYE